VAARQTNSDRVRFFSDAVFAVLITILVLELKPPHADTFSALLPLWPTALSYAVSYVFIAIVWVNHLCWEAVDRPAHEDVSQRIRRLLRMRSFVTIGIFAAAALVALRWPVVAMALICLCLVGYLRPDIPAPNNGAGTA